MLKLNRTIVSAEKGIVPPYAQILPRYHETIYDALIVIYNTLKIPSKIL